MTDQPYGNVPLFRDLSADRFEDQEATELESMCMNCHEDVSITSADVFISRIEFLISLTRVVVLRNIYV